MSNSKSNELTNNKVTSSLMRSRERSFFLVFLLPAVLALLIVTIFPIIYGLYASLHDASLSQMGKFIGLGNYIKAFMDKSFYISLRVTFLFVIGAVTLELILGILIAVLLHAAQFKSTIVKTLLLIPMAATPAVVGICWRLMYDTDMGIINYLLGVIGIPKILWLVNPTVALISLIIVDVWQWTPFIMLIIYAGLESIPQDIYEASAIDGAGGFTRFFKISLPLLSPLISIAVFLRAIDAYKMFDIAYITTSGGPGTSTENASLFAYRQGFNFFHTGYASALAIIMLIIIILLDYFRKKSMKLFLK